MISHFKDSNITEVKSGIIIHGCNAQGVMGSGVAKQLRAKYPDIFTDYLALLQLCKDEQFTPLGQVAFTKVSPDLKIASAITQEFYGRDGKQYVSYDALQAAFYHVSTIALISKQEVHVPYLIGAGLGGGDEKTILDIIAESAYNINLNFHHWK